MRERVGEESRVERRKQEELRQRGLRVNCAVLIEIEPRAVLCPLVLHEVNVGDDVVIVGEVGRWDVDKANGNIHAVDRDSIGSALRWSDRDKLFEDTQVRGR